MSFRVDPNRPTSFSPVPPGQYNVVVTESAWKDAKSGGRYLNVRLDIQGPTHQGRVIWWRCNLENANETAVQIANDQMNGFCLSAGIAGWDDPGELIGRRVVARVKIGKAQPGYEAQNEVSGFVWGEDAAKVASAPATTPGATAAPTPAPAKKGWA